MTSARADGCAVLSRLPVCLSKLDGRPPRTRASHALPAYGRSNECAGGYKQATRTRTRTTTTAARRSSPAYGRSNECAGGYKDEDEDDDDGDSP